MKFIIVSFDFTPSFEAFDEEPSLRDLLLKYYQERFDKEEAECLVERYIVAQRENFYQCQSLIESR